MIRAITISVFFILMTSLLYELAIIPHRRSRIDISYDYSEKQYEDLKLTFANDPGILSTLEEAKKGKLLGMTLEQFRLSAGYIEEFAEDKNYIDFVLSSKKTEYHSYLLIKFNKPNNVICRITFGTYLY